MSGKKSATDHDIVAWVRGGDHRAEGLLVQRYYGRVLARVSAKVGDPQAAADITQEVILGVLCALREGRLRSVDRIAQYVSATTTNVVRRHRARRVASPGYDLTEIASGAPTPDELAGQREQLGAVGRALHQLTERDRGILAMTLVDGLTSREVSQLTGMSAASVRQRKARALRKLRTRVSDELLNLVGAGSPGELKS
jgi:RNA polymerase sigma-70 factor (ECF subfamily)